MKTASAIQPLEKSYLSLSFKQLSDTEIEITQFDEITYDFHHPDLASKTLCIVNFDESKYVKGIQIGKQNFTVVNPAYYANYRSFMDI